MNIPLVNITMPVFNRFDITLKTIENLVKNTSTPYILTVVDNGSEEDLRKELIKIYKQGIIKYLFLLDKNYGISCACNIGWQHVNAPFFMKLDNDIHVLSSTWLSDIFQMWGRLRYKTIIGPVWNCNASIGRIDTPFGVLWNMPVSFSGQAFMVSAKVRDSIGYFSEDYGLYGEEDADYCLRCHHAGIRKYSFEASGMLENVGNDTDVYDTYSINKSELHKINVGNAERAGIFALNLFLYKTGLRSLKVPLRYYMHDCRDCHVTVRENPQYDIWHNKLLACLDIYNNSGSETISNKDIEKVRNILG